MSNFDVSQLAQGAGRTAEKRFPLGSALSLLYSVAAPVSYPGVADAAQQENAEISYAGIEVIPDEERPLSHLGTPIFYPITFGEGTYNRYDHSGKVEQVSLPALRLPISTVVEMSRGKVITKTPVVAGIASVKEFYANEDWQMRVSGILFDEPNQPNGATTLEVMQERMLEWFDLADAIEIEGDLFHQRGIYRVVIKSYSFNQIPGYPRKHGFQFECESDDPLELIIL